MRKAYEDVANPTGWNYSNPLIKEVVEVCSQLADAELAEQAKQHEANHQKELLMTAAIYEREIAKLEREIVVLNVKILTDCLTESERETRDARNTWG